MNALNQFAYNKEHPDSPINSDAEENIQARVPELLTRISVFHSATAIFFAPSDISGVGGMRKEVIRATPLWRGGSPRYDCVYVVTDGEMEGFRGLSVARVKLFFSFKLMDRSNECALVHWFKTVGEAPDKDTGMWVVEPDYIDIDVVPNRRNRAGAPPQAPIQENRKPLLSIISVDTILRAAHLVPVYGEGFIPVGTQYSDSLDKFDQFFVNKYIDHHSYEIAL